MGQSNVTLIKPKKKSLFEQHDQIVLESTAEGLRLLKENLRAEIATVDEKLDEHGSRSDAALSEAFERCNTAIEELAVSLEDRIVAHETVTDEAIVEASKGLETARRDYLDARVAVDRQVSTLAATEVKAAVDKAMERQTGLLRDYFERLVTGHALALDVALDSAEATTKAYDQAVQLCLSAYANMGDKLGLKNFRAKYHPAFDGDDTRDRNHLCEAIRVYLLERLDKVQRCVADSTSALHAAGYAYPQGWRTPPGPLDTDRSLRTAFAGLESAIQSLRQLDLVSQERDSELDRLRDNAIRRLSMLSHISTAQTIETLKAADQLQRGSMPVGRDPFKGGFDRALKLFSEAKRGAAEEIFKATARAFQ